MLAEWIKCTWDRDVIDSREASLDAKSARHKVGLSYRRHGISWLGNGLDGQKKRLAKARRFQKPSTGLGFLILALLALTLEQGSQASHFNLQGFIFCTQEYYLTHHR